MLTDQTLEAIERLSNQINALSNWQWESPPGNIISKLMFLRQKLREAGQRLDLVVRAVDVETSEENLRSLRDTIGPSDAAMTGTAQTIRWSNLSLRDLQAQAIADNNTVYEETLARARRLLETGPTVQQQVHTGRALNSATHPRQRAGEGVSVENMEISEQALEALPEVQGNPDLELPRVDGATDMQLGVSRRVQSTDGTVQRSEQEGASTEVLRPYGWTTVFT